MHIRSLAWLLQCSESRLSNGLGSVHKEDGVSTMYCWGQVLATNHVLLAVMATNMSRVRSSRRPLS